VTEKPVRRAYKAERAVVSRPSVREDGKVTADDAHQSSSKPANLQDRPFVNQSWLERYTEIMMRTVRHRARECRDDAPGS